MLLRCNIQVYHTSRLQRVGECGGGCRAVNLALCVWGGWFGFVSSHDCVKVHFLKQPQGMSVFIHVKSMEDKTFSPLL